MANSILTPTAVTREALRIAHEKLTFVGTINRQYDDSFAKSGARIGDSLKIRLPNQYTVRTGKTLNAQDTSEESVTLTVATQVGVDMNFSSAELTMELDDFSKRILEPAISQLASHIEYDALTNMTKDVYNQVGTAGTTPATLAVIGDARAKLNQYLAPKDMRSMQMDSVAMAALVNAFSTLQNPAASVSRQYLEGFVKNAVGFDWYENERILTHTNGSDVSCTINTDTLANGDTTVAVTGLSSAPTAGSVFTFATGGVYAVHPETKQSYGHLQQFVVVEATTSQITFSPAIYSSGAKQNVAAMPSTTSALTWVGNASAALEQHVAYHKDAFAFATADLVLPEGVHFAAREQFEGVSMRIVRNYDINSDNFPCRLDVLYGYKTIRPQWACRITG
jgi:hypothetical protein